MNPSGYGAWGDGLWCGVLGTTKVEIWPVAVVWAPKALFGVLGSEPLADLTLPGLWRGFWSS